MTTFSPLLERDCLALQTTHPNVLVVGPDAAVDQALRTLREVCRQPVMTHGESDVLGLRSPCRTGTLVLRDVGRLSLNDQHRLIAWLENACGRTQIIATNARALWPCLETGAFLAGLYYRLNTVHFDLTGECPRGLHESAQGLRVVRKC